MAYWSDNVQAQSTDIEHVDGLIQSPDFNFDFFDDDLIYQNSGFYSDDTTPSAATHDDYDNDNGSQMSYMPLTPSDYEQPTHTHVSNGMESSPKMTKGMEAASRDSKSDVQHSLYSLHENTDPALSQEPTQHQFDFQNNVPFDQYRFGQPQHLVGNDPFAATAPIYEQPTSGFTPLSLNDGANIEPAQFNIINNTSYNGMSSLAAINAVGATAPARNSNRFAIGGEKEHVDGTAPLQLSNLPHRQSRIPAPVLDQHLVPSATPPWCNSTSDGYHGEKGTITTDHGPLSGYSGTFFTTANSSPLRHVKVGGGQKHSRRAINPISRVRDDVAPPPYHGSLSPATKLINDHLPSGYAAGSGTDGSSPVSSSFTPTAVATNQASSNRNYSYSIFTNAELQLQCASANEAEALMDTRTHVPINGDDMQQVTANKLSHVLNVKTALLKRGYKPAPRTKERLVYTWNPNNITATSDQQKKTSDEFTPLNEAERKEWDRFNIDQIKQILVAHAIPKNTNRAEGYAWKLVEEILLIHTDGYVPSTSGFDHGLICSVRIDTIVTLIEDYPVLRVEMFSGSLDIQAFAANPVGYMSKKIANMWSNLQRKLKGAEKQKKDNQIYLACHAILDVHMPKKKVKEWWKDKKAAGALGSILMKEDKAEEGVGEEAEPSDDVDSDEDEEEEVAKTPKLVHSRDFLIEREDDEEDVSEAHEDEDEDASQSAEDSMIPNAECAVDRSLAISQFRDSVGNRERIGTAYFDDRVMPAGNQLNTKYDMNKIKQSRPTPKKSSAISSRKSISSSPEQIGSSKKKHSNYPPKKRRLDADGSSE